MANGWREESRDSERALLISVSSFGLESQARCQRCSALLPGGALECVQCHALTHASELQSISAEAKRLESSGQLRQAREKWLSAIPLLPNDSKQAEWINHHAVDLYARALEAEAEQAHKPNQHQWAKRFGPLAPLLVLLAKAKSLLVLLKFKFLLTLFAFVGFYWAMFGKWFGIGFAALILCHEMGHFIEVKRRGLPVEMPVFLPGFGAYVRWQNLGISLEGRCMIALAGPLAGLISSAACLAMFPLSHQRLWLALAHTGAWLNLLNLVPVWALDGGHAIAGVSKAGRAVLLGLAVLMFAATREGMFLVVAGGSAWQAFGTQPPNEPSQRVTIHYGFLLCGLAVVMWLARGVATPF